MATDPPLTPDDLVDALLLSDAVKQADFPQAERAGELLRRLADGGPPRDPVSQTIGRWAIDAILPILRHPAPLGRRLLRPGDCTIRDGIPALAREIARLDALCRAHGIDPEPGNADRPGPREGPEAAAS